MKHANDHESKREGEVWLYGQRWCWKMMVTNVPLRPVKPTPWLQMGPLHAVATLGIFFRVFLGGITLLQFFFL